MLTLCFHGKIPVSPSWGRELFVTICSSMVSAPVVPAVIPDHIGDIWLPLLAGLRHGKTVSLRLRFLSQHVSGPFLPKIWPAAVLQVEIDEPNETIAVLSLAICAQITIISGKLPFFGLRS